MKRIIASLVLAAGLIFSGTLAHGVPSASASSVDGTPGYCDNTTLVTVLSIVSFYFTATPAAIFPCLGGHLEGVPYNCLLTNVDVNGNTTVHSYDYGMGGECSFTIRGAYDVNTKQASEKLSGDAGKISAIWTCSADPWIFQSGQAPTCVLVNAAADKDDGAFDFSHSTLPFSVQLLTDHDRFVLSAQLQNALNQKPATPAPSPLGHAIGTKLSEPCFACPDGPASNVPVQPDLSVSISGKTSLSSGMTAPYTITIKNQGAPLSGNPVVQLALAFGGKLQEYATSDTGAFTCTPGATINCTGHLDASGQATLTFQGWGSAAGTGSVQATVDPSQSLPDSNYSNNTQTLTVTIS